MSWYNLYCIKVTLIIRDVCQPTSLEVLNMLCKCQEFSNIILRFVRFNKGMTRPIMDELDEWFGIQDQLFYEVSYRLSLPCSSLIRAHPHLRYECSQDQGQPPQIVMCWARPEAPRPWLQALYRPGPQVGPGLGSDQAQAQGPGQGFWIY